MLVRPAGLVATAGAAAGAVVGSGILALSNLERVAAAAGSDDVRIVDREATLKTLDEIDLSALEVRSAVGVDHDPHALDVKLVVPLERAPVEAERVPEPGAAPTLARTTQDGRFTLGLLGHQLGDLRGGPLGERDKSDRAFGELHLNRILAACPALTPALGSGVLDTTL